MMESNIPDNCVQASRAADTNQSNKTQATHTLKAAVTVSLILHHQIPLRKFTEVQIRELN
jgi:hypothetical protein